ncbi:MAG: 30S ribosomal protein S6e [Candidatus Woesearchaeota archaeon]
MVSFKVVIGTKNGRCVQKEIREPEAKTFLGKKIGDTISGDAIGLTGYEFVVTGGSDYCGFPMRKDVEGFARKRILAVKGVGLKMKAKGIRQRKTVCGNTIHPKISQVNLKVTKEGKEPLAAPAEEKKEEAK